MEYNKDEAKKAMEIAVCKVLKKDYYGAKKFINKAQNMYPELDGLKQVLTMIDVFISASNEGEEADWYGILKVDPLADDEEIKKQYKKLALLLHPDKNKINGAEGAFKLVCEAWCLLSDKGKRTSYDQKRRSNDERQKPNSSKPSCYNGIQKAKDSVDPSACAGSNKYASGMKNQPNPHKPESSSEDEFGSSKSNEHASADSSEQWKGNTFWTMCKNCKEKLHLRDSCLYKLIHCPNCARIFIATEKTPVKHKWWYSFKKSFNLKKKSKFLYSLPLCNRNKTVL